MYEYWGCGDNDDDAYDAYNAYNAADDDDDAEPLLHRDFLSTVT